MLFPLGKTSTHGSRVVVTGSGIVTSLGFGWSINAEGFRSGRRAFSPVTLFDVSRQRVKSAGQIASIPPLPKTKLNRRQSSRLDRAAQLLLHATAEAWQQANWETGTNIPIVLGTTSGGMNSGETYFRQATTTPETHRSQPRRVIHYQAQRHALDVQDAFGFSGPISVITNACASGANAVGHAWDLIRTGQAERVLAGGYDALSQMTFVGFDSLHAMSPTECRPFDAARDGLALGEGAAVLNLETLASAEKRGATILGEIVGYGAANDLHHLTQPQPEGKAALSAMSSACKSAGLSPDQIDYVNAHGTGTPLNDSAEAAAINTWAGARVASLAVSSTKSNIGHLLGAAGAVESVICLMALRGQWMPPTTNIHAVDPMCSFRVVRKPAAAALNYILTNSFGFGGANASLIFRRCA